MSSPPEERDSVSDDRVQLAVIDHRLLAVKRIEHATSVDTARLLHEAEVLRSVTHPNVVTVVALDDTDDDDVTLYLDAVGRHTLADAPPQRADDLAAVTRDLLTIVGELHEGGVTHGSLAADHVVVGSSGKLTLISFGSGRRTRPGSLDHDVAIRDDLSALGAMIAELAGALEITTLSDRRRIEQVERLATRLREEPTQAVAEQLRRCAQDPNHLRRRPPRRISRRGRAQGRRRVERRRDRRVVVEPPRAAPPTEPGWAWPALVLGIGCIVGLWLAGGAPRNPFDQTSSPIASAVEGVRTAALVAAGYLVAAAVISLAASAVGSARLERLAGAITPRWLRRTAVILTGAGVLASLSPTSAPAPSTPTTTTDRAAFPSRTSVESAPTTSAVRSSSTTSSSTIPAPNLEVAQPPDAATEVRSVIVEPGDHLWSIAARELERRFSRPPTNPEIDPYWRAVVEANRGRLVDPTNPDLLHRGQTIELPPTPDAGPQDRELS